jgi:catalase
VIAGDDDAVRVRLELGCSLLRVLWPILDVAPMPAGRRVLDRNSENLFAQIVQAAFDVANMIPGIETPAPPGRLTGQGAQGCSRHYQRGSAVS